MRTSHLGARSVLGGHVAHQVHHAVRVGPLVVVPRHDLEEALLSRQVVLQGRLGVVDGAAVVVDKVGADELLIGEAEDALHVRLRRLLDGLVDLLDRRVARCAERQIHDGHVRRRHAEGHASQLALGGRNHHAHGLRGASRARDDVYGRRAATTPVLERHAVHRLLRCRVGVNGGHQTGLDAEVLLRQHVHNGGQAVGRARRIRHHVVRRRRVLVLVHAHHNRLGAARRRGADHNLLRATLDVALSLQLVREQAGRLDHIVHTKLAPRQVRRVALRLHALDTVAVHHKHIRRLHGWAALHSLHCVFRAAVHRVVLHLVCKVFGIRAHVHHRDDVDLSADKTLVTDGLEYHATDAAEAVDADLDGSHCKVVGVGVGGEGCWFCCVERENLRVMEVRAV
ncbi:glyceraldehyde 3-phosphate dehydrogenase, glycosomal [Leishmania tarentolae]|uniref:Glyceraldehyde 3-phosphate dehydrogenase, glycosomal n=1 Tax=Leishmania tarentolae TaxID=5689 RepID=A0A640KMG6_LEITA|nr:glyceraldehyde 3-phosphate dehydrogenase, glycosomal [Leishmania tarentolae]